MNITLILNHDTFQAITMAEHWEMTKVSINKWKLESDK